LHNDPNVLIDDVSENCEDPLKKEDPRNQDSVSVHSYKSTADDDNITFSHGIYDHNGIQEYTEFHEWYEDIFWTYDLQWSSNKGIHRFDILIEMVC